VADVFRRHGAAYRKAHAGHLSRGQRRVMGAIENLPLGSAGEAGILSPRFASLGLNDPGCEPKQFRQAAGSGQPAWPGDLVILPAKSGNRRH
jgi:hypothetical protein